MFLVVPLFFYRPAIDVTLTPKFVLLAVLLLAFLPLLHFQVHKKLSLKALFKPWPVRLWLGFLLLSALSLSVAYNPWEGVFDLFRLGMLLCFLIAFMLFMMMDKALLALRWTVILLAWAQALIGLYQYGAFVFGEADLQQLYRIYGLMSHKNVFSGMMFLTLPMLVYSIYSGSRPERFTAAGAFTLELLMLMLMQTRAQWLAVLALILIPAILAIFLPAVRQALWGGKGRKSAGMIGLCLGIAVLSASLLTQASLSAARQGRLDAPAKGDAITGLGERAASIVDNKTQNRQTRLVIWGYTWQMIQDRPWLGVGAGNWKIKAPGYYEKGYMTTQYHNWRRPHNDFLLIAAEKGVPALGVYLAFFMLLAWKGLRYLGRSSDRQGLLLVLLALGGLAGYSLDSMFSFPYERLDMGMMAMLYTGLILGIEKQPVPAHKGSPEHGRPWVLYGMMAFLLASLPLGRIWVRGEVAANEAYAHNSAGRWTEAVKAIDRGYTRLTQIDPSNNPLLWFRGKAHMNLNHVEQARHDLELALQQMPRYLTVLSELGVLHGRMGEHARALEYLQEAHEILPSDRLVLYNMGLANYNLGRYQEALDCLYQCLTDKEDPRLNALIHEIKVKLFGPQPGDPGGPPLETPAP